MTTYMYDHYSPYCRMYPPHTFSSPNPATSYAPRSVGKKRSREMLFCSPQETLSPAKRLCQAVLFSPSQGTSSGKKQNQGIILSSSMATASSGKKRTRRILFSSPQKTLSSAKKLCQAIIFSPSQRNPSPGKEHNQFSSLLWQPHQVENYSLRHKEPSLLRRSYARQSSFLPQRNPSPGKMQGQEMLHLDKENYSPSGNKNIHLFIASLLAEAMDVKVEFILSLYMFNYSLCLSV
jgi:hypothetical protein